MNYICSKLRRFLSSVNPSQNRQLCKDLQKEITNQQICISHLQKNIQTSENQFDQIGKLLMECGKTWLFELREGSLLIGLAFEPKGHRCIKEWKLYYISTSNPLLVLEAETEYISPTKNDGHCSYIKLRTLHTAGFPNHGYGSVFMNHLKQYGKDLGCDHISATVSFVDTENPRDPANGPRLLHFYQKHGFDIPAKLEKVDFIYLDLKK